MLGLNDGPSHRLPSFFVLLAMLDVRWGNRWAMEWVAKREREWLVMMCWGSESVMETDGVRAECSVSSGSTTTTTEKKESSENIHGEDRKRQAQLSEHKVQ